MKIKENLKCAKHPRITHLGLISIVEDRRKEPSSGLYHNCEVLLHHHPISPHEFLLPKGVCMLVGGGRRGRDSDGQRDTVRKETETHNEYPGYSST